MWGNSLFAFSCGKASHSIDFDRIVKSRENHLKSGGRQDKENSAVLQEAGENERFLDTLFRFI